MALNGVAKRSPDWDSSTVVPVVMVTGFLGSGKTTLIARQLDQHDEDSLAVLVHDLGEENIDVAYLQGGEHVSLASDKRIRSVSSGPLTTSHLEQLGEELDQLSQQEPPPAAIIIESSGAADVTSLVRQLRTAGSLWQLISVVTVLDTSLLGHYSNDPMIAPLLERQASVASLLILNKWDRATRSERAAANRYVRSVCRVTGASVVRTKFGRVRPAELFRPRSVPAGVTRGDRELGTAIESIHLKERRPFHPQRLERWLGKDWPGIVRVKGFLWLATDMEGVYVLDAAGPQREVGLEGTWYAAVGDRELKDDTEVQRLLADHPWGDRRQALTVIGSTSGVTAAQGDLHAALLTDQEMAEGPESWIDYPDPLTPQFS